MKNFQDKTVVITGAGSGMGRAYAQEFGRLGSRLALNDYDPEGLAQTVDLLAGQGITDVLAEAFDVGDKQAMLGFASRVADDCGGAHVVINNAGVEGAVKPVWATDETDFERIMKINFFGVVHGTRAFLPQLMAHGEGAVVNVSSIFGLIGTPNHADYCASKFAVRGFTEALMVELQDSPVDAFLVHPGGIATNIVRNSAGREFSDHFLTTPPEAIARHVVRCIRRRQLRIVYGKGALKTWLGSLLVPQRLLNRLIWAELKPVTDLSAYPSAR